jgi:hypothetical protein
MPQISDAEDAAQARQTVGGAHAQLGYTTWQLPIRSRPTQTCNTATETGSWRPNFRELEILVLGEPWDLQSTVRADHDLVADFDQLDMTNLAFQRLVRGDLELLDATINAGADIERENRDGLTMLVTAIKDSNVPLTALLLFKGADPEHYVQGKPPLFHAVESQEHGPQLLRLLLDFGADTTTTNGPAQMNALHWAAATGMIDAADYLLSRGIDIEETCAGEHTALHVAAGTGHLRVVLLLLAQGAELSKRGELGNNALTLASSRGYTDIRELLIQKGLPVGGSDQIQSEFILALARGFALAWSAIASCPRDLL